VQWVCKKSIYLLRVTPDEVKELNALTGAYFAVQLKDKAQAEKMLKFFLSRGVDINSVDTKITNAGLTALHNAVYANEPKEVELLLAHGARTEVRSHKNQTPLELAWALQYLQPQQDRSRIIQLLAEGGPAK
jgi:ankyrin repeat protein